MKILTINDIRAFKTCYDPVKYIPEDWRGSVIDVLNLKEVPFKDKLWLIFRNEFVSDKLMRLFVAWCYRQTLAFVKNPDPGSIEAADTAERYANGLATDEELRSAAQSIVWVVAELAGAAAWETTRSTAWLVQSAAEASGAAAYSAWGAAWSTARLAQEQKLREMLITGIETGDVK